MLCWDRLTVDSLPRADGARFWFGLQAAASREHRFGSRLPLSPGRSSRASVTASGVEHRRA